MAKSKDKNSHLQTSTGAATSDDGMQPAPPPAISFGKTARDLDKVDCTNSLVWYLKGDRAKKEAD